MVRTGEYEQVNKTAKLLKDNGFKVVRRAEKVEGFICRDEGDLTVYRALKLRKGWMMWYDEDVFTFSTKQEKQ